MIRHDTPPEIAHALAKHAPKKMSSLLEPAVGSGILLEPFVKRFESTLTRIVGIDNDLSALQLSKSRMTTVIDRFDAVYEDFLVWSARHKVEADLYDCIVMNPPFSGRKRGMISLDLSVDAPGSGMRIRRVPIEVAFVLRCIGLLRPGGRLLAVVPSSLVSSTSTAWMRRYLLSTGSILYVHELPRFTFSRVESRIYLFVYERSSKRKTTILRNHDLQVPTSMKVRAADLTSLTRFDYRYHQALGSYLALRKSTHNIQWSRLSAIADVSRGLIPSPNGTKISLHTCDYRTGFWGVADPAKTLSTARKGEGIKRGDIFIKRVGRNCSNTAGIIVGNNGKSASDCLLRVRPKKPRMSVPLLLALRVLLGSDFGAALFERGTGASYISEKQLREILIPIGLDSRYRCLFSRYEMAVTRRNFSGMITIERRLRNLISRRNKNRRSKAIME